MKIVVSNLLIVFFAVTCTSWKEDKVLITKKYVVNPNWSKNDDYNPLSIYKMLLKDSSKTIDLKNPSEPELYHNLKIDTTFSYRTMVKYNGEDFAQRKVYFNRYNGFLWRNRYLNEEKETIGVLEQNTWYLIYGLSKIHTTKYYIYLDSSDSLRTFKVSTMTNI